MEGNYWKQKAFEIVVGFLAFMGGLLVRKIKPIWKEFKRISGVTDKMDDHNSRIWILEQTLEKLMHTDPNPLFIVNSKGELVYANPAWARLSGWDDVTLAYGKNYLKAIVKHDRDDVESMADMQSEHPSSVEVDIRFQHLKTHEIINTICRAEPMFGEDSKHIKTLGRLYICVIK